MGVKADLPAPSPAPPPEGRGVPATTSGAASPDSPSLSDSPLPSGGGAGGGGWPQARGAGPIGIHALIDLYEITPALLTDAAHLAVCLTEAARAAGMTPLSAPVLHRFPGGGLTGFLPLAESHIAFHTYPEWGYLAADVFTCGANGPEAAIAALRAGLRPGRECVRLLPRGGDLVP